MQHIVFCFIAEGQPLWYCVIMKRTDNSNTSCFSSIDWTFCLRLIRLLIMKYLNDFNSGVLHSIPLASHGESEQRSRQVKLNVSLSASISHSLYPSIFACVPCANPLQISCGAGRQLAGAFSFILVKGFNVGHKRTAGFLKAPFHICCGAALWMLSDVFNRFIYHLWFHGQSFCFSPLCVL